MDNEDRSTGWWVAIGAISLATAFIYFLIFNPQDTSNWVMDNLVLAWAILGVAMSVLGVYFFIRSRNGEHATYDRIRSGAYSFLGLAILLVLLTR